jgi:hypothetical protein
MKKRFLFLGGLINEIEPGSIWFNDFSRPERNMWNETGTFRLEFSQKIQNGPRFEMRWKLFCFLNWYEMFRPLRTNRNGIDNLGWAWTPLRPPWGCAWTRPHLTWVWVWLCAPTPRWAWTPLAQLGVGVDASTPTWGLGVEASTLTFGLGEDASRPNLDVGVDASRPNLGVDVAGSSPTWG